MSASWPPSFPEPGSLFATSFEHSWAWVVLCTLTPHIQQVSSSLRDLLRKTLQGTWLALLMSGSLHNVLLQAAVPWTVTWSSTVRCVMWPVTLSCYNPCWAVLGRGKQALKKCTFFLIEVKEAGCLSWVLYSKRTYFYTSTFSFLYSYCFNMLSLMLSFRSRLISFRFMGFQVCQER